MPRWLTDDEQAAWRLLVTVLHKLPGHLDHALRGHDLRFFDYLLLAMLSEAPERTRRMHRLAEVTDASLSRLSHAVRRLEERGLVRRHPSTDDGRVTLATLTDHGVALVDAAAPDHVESVQQAVFDALTPAQVTALRDALADVVADLAPGITPGVDDE